MFTNRTVAGVAMLFAAVILAHPGPAIAQADVDKAMGIILQDKPAEFKPIGPGGGEVGMEKSDEDDEKPASQGIALPGETKGFNPQPDPPKRSAAKGIALPGATKGFNPQPDPPKLKGLKAAPAMKKY